MDGFGRRIIKNLKMRTGGQMDENPSLEACYGRYGMDHSVWTIRYGLYDMDHMVIISQRHTKRAFISTDLHKDKAVLFFLDSNDKSAPAFTSSSAAFG